MADLRSPRLKVEWAKKHIRELDRLIRSFLDSDPYPILTKENPEIGWILLCIGDSKPIPDSFSLVIGDVVHNLRTALDHLACQLVPHPSNVTAFPICGSPKEYRVAMKRGKIEGMCEDAKRLIAAVQPYATGDHTLWHVHELDRADKHRLVITVACAFERFGIQDIWFEPDWFRRFPLESGNELFHLPTDTYRASRDKLKFSFDIAFGQTEILAGKPVLETLSKMADLVDGVIGKFQRFIIS